MSQLLGAVSILDQVIQADDRRHARMVDQFKAEAYAPPNPFLKAEYRTQFWPGARGLGGGALLGDGGDVNVMNPAYWEPPEVTRGCSSRWGVIGVARDQYGSIIVGMTMKLYRTSTDEMVSTIVSDGNGAYLLTTPYYPDAHYIVGYKAGFPDIYGTTVNTIVAA